MKHVLASLLVAAASGGLFVTPVAAQTRWGVLAVASAPSDEPRATDLAAHLRATLEAQGETLVGEARERIRARVGVPFQPAPRDLVERLTRAAEVVLDDVAFARSERAIASAEPILEEASSHLAALGRLPESSVDLGNLCLYLVRADSQLHEDARARARVETCLRLVPDLEPSDRNHPESVRALVTSVRDELAAQRIGGTLSIQTEASDPEGCMLRVQGRPMGQSPWARIPLPAGSYAIQAECVEGRPGRITTVQVQAGEPARLVVSVLLSSTLNDDGSALVYETSSDLSRRMPGDLAVVGGALQATRLLVAVVEGGQLSVQAFEVQDGAATARLTGSAPVEGPIDRDSSRQAVEVARSGRLLGRPTRDSTTVIVREGGGDVGVAVLGGTLLTVGAVGLGISWYFWTEVDARGQELNRVAGPGELTDATRAFDAADTPVIVLGAAGGALSTVGAALLLTQSDEAVPWWSWLIGAAGLGVGGVGIYMMTTEGACYGNPAVAECQRRSPTLLLGTLILEHAGPLLAVPITCLFRALVGVGADAGTASVSVAPSGVQVSWSATF